MPSTSKKFTVHHLKLAFHNSVDVFNGTAPLLRASNKRRFASAVYLMRIRTKRSMTCCLNYLPYQAASQAACVSGTNQAAQLSSRGPRRACVWHGVRAAISTQDSFRENLPVIAWRSDRLAVTARLLLWRKATTCKREYSPSPLDVEAAARGCCIFCLCFYFWYDSRFLFILN